MKDKIKGFFTSPAFFNVTATALVIAVIAAFSFAMKKSPDKDGDKDDAAVRSVLAELDDVPVQTTVAVTAKRVTLDTTAKVTTTTAATTVTTTTTAGTTTAAVTEPPQTEPAEPVEPEVPQEPVQNDPPPPPAQTQETPPPGQPLSPYVNAGTSPNAAFYQSRLAIAGDSIASGYQLYGYIPYAHNIAKESVGLWNLNNNTFNFGYGNMSMVDSVAYMKPKLLMVSMGMNDLLNKNASWFGGLYSDLINRLLAADPDVNIVCAAISPVSPYHYYTTNENIRNYNAAISNVVSSLDSPRVYYFDAYSVLADPNTLALNASYGGGDGLHLNSATYGVLLTALFNYLDTTPVMENIQSSEAR